MSSRTAFAILPVLAAAFFLAVSVATRHGGALDQPAATRLPPPTRITDYGEVADFELVDQQGRRVTRESLLGKVWVAGFVYSRCSGPCPTIMARVGVLQEEIFGGENPPDDVVLCMFSVDPEHDTSEVLAGWGERVGADGESWLLLTGEPEAVRGVVRGSFHLGVERAEPGTTPPGQDISHSTRLALVDRDAHIRGYFDSTDATALATLRMQVRKLAAATP